MWAFAGGLIWVVFHPEEYPVLSSYLTKTRSLPYPQNIMPAIAKCWYVPEAQLKAGMEAIVIATYKQDTTLENVAIRDEDAERYKSDALFHEASDQAMKAVKDCSPLRFLPPTKYEEWKVMELKFDPAPGPKP